MSARPHSHIRHGLCAVHTNLADTLLTTDYGYTAPGAQDEGLKFLPP
jgi:hypothetical protein